MFFYEVELVLSYFNLKLTQQRLEIEKLKLLAKKQEESVSVAFEKNKGKETKGEQEWILAN